MADSQFEQQQQQRHKHLLGHTIADGRLELVSILGLGAYGVVYLARDMTHPLHSNQPFASSSTTDLPRILASRHGGAASGYYAVKCLNKLNLDNRQKRFQRREIVLHTMVTNHPSVVTLYRVIDEKNDPCIYVIMDYCPDGDLFSMITENQRYTVPAPSLQQGCTDAADVDLDVEYQSARSSMDNLIRDVFCQILDAVAFCHTNGIYHRDLKPENILCLQGGAKAVLADFGLATSEKTSSDFGCGSTFYMGPECQGGISTQLDRYTTAANDVWSLGVILVNLICGRNPWKQASIDDETFREYLRNPDFLMEILPISKQTNALLKRVFTIREEWRCSLADLREMVHQVDRFTATQTEIVERQRIARHAAQRARQEEVRARKVAEEARRQAEIRHGVEDICVSKGQPHFNESFQQAPSAFSDTCANITAVEPRPIVYPAPQTPVKAQRSTFTTPEKQADLSCPTTVTSFASDYTSEDATNSTPDSPVESEFDMMPDDDSSRSDSAESRRSSYSAMPPTPVFEPLHQQQQRVQMREQEQQAAYEALHRAKEVPSHLTRPGIRQPTTQIHHAAAAATLNCSLQNLAIQSLLPHAADSGTSHVEASILQQDAVQQHVQEHFIDSSMSYPSKHHHGEQGSLYLDTHSHINGHKHKSRSPGSPTSHSSRFRTLPSRGSLRPPAFAANAKRLRNNIFGS